MKQINLLVLLALLCAAFPDLNLQGQMNSDLDRYRKQINVLTKIMERKVNQEVPHVVYECNNMKVDRKHGGDIFLTLKLVRNGTIKIKGDANSLKTAILRSTIPVKTEKGDAYWYKKECLSLFGEEHCEDITVDGTYYTAFNLNIQSVITKKDGGPFIVQSTGTYQWKDRPVLTLNLGFTNVDVSMGTVSGKALQKLIDDYIKDVDQEISNYLNRK